MKNLYILLSALICLILLFPYHSYSQVKDESGRNILDEGENFQDNNMPVGVTQDWLNNLTDEKGNRINPESITGGSGIVPEEPETDGMQRKVFNGPAANSQLGYSVSDAGDINGDGFGDIIIGAQGYSSNTGRAYIYFGGLNMNTVADVILTGETVSSNFGIAVSGAGDVNGDGFDDVIIGANGYNTGTGRACIYFGGNLVNNVADVILNGSGIFDSFGASVSSAGDVNGDGYSDVIVGASTLGRAFIFFGGALMNNTSDITFIGQVNTGFGYSVSSAGDVNGDGYSDVIVGAYALNLANIYFGGAFMNNAADVVMTGDAAFGASVSDAGDVNGDGYSDVIVGAYGFSTFTGKVSIFFGGASMNNAADVIMTGETATNQFGVSVSGAGDLNGDGYSDVIVGATYGGTGNTGKSYVFFGGTSVNNIPDVVMTGEAGFSFFGYSVSSAGDVNGDGYPDLIVGGYTYNSGTGRAYLFDYFMKGEITHDLTMTGETNSSFGYSVSSAGDVNGDGYSDVIVGAYGFSSSTGRAYIYFGGAPMNNIADVTLTGESTSGLFGGSVSTAGDVNGDGFSDVIVGAVGYSGYTGRAYIFYGGASMDDVTDVVMTGEAPSSFGASVSSAGDVNGDGYSDVIVGANDYSSNTGRAYVYLGGASMDNNADVIMTGESTTNFFGYSVSSAGDVNGDGYSDVIAGAYFYSSNTGRTYVYFGGASMNNVADVIMTGEASNINFGKSVSSAGDVNGDGYSDVVVGADTYLINTGRAYVYFGGASMNNVADVTMTGESPNNNFGRSVSSAGDVNGDGFSDVIAGAGAYSASTGRAYLFFGGTTMNNIADVSMTGETINDRFGFAVSTAGDVNGDGYSDVITSAYQNSSFSGKAYIYNGSAISSKPILNYVKDVPNDQGGIVNLKWSRSSLDVIGDNTITNYNVEYSYPPSGGNFAWLPASIVPATKNSFYSVNVTTPYDSSGTSPGTFFFRVTAQTINSSVYWRSAILTGRSIDNIAPLMVSPFTALSAGVNVNLNWSASTAPDLLNYILFRSTNPVIDPYAETPLSTVTATTYLDTAPLSGLYYYFIVAQDIHGNYSPVADTESPRINLHLTMLIQGFYNTGGTNLMVEDTARVYLRNSSAPYTMVDSSKAFLSNTGAGTFPFANAVNGANYYIQLKHRNSIETWSKTAVVFSNNVLTYDFSNSVTKAYGDNQVQVSTTPPKFAIYSGDVNQDGFADLTDINTVFNAAGNFVSGYVLTDVNGDNIVDLTDLTITYNNSGNFVSSIIP